MCEILCNVRAEIVEFLLWSFWGVQVQDLSKAANEFESLPAMIDYDIRNNSVRDGGSHTRNLLRVLRGVDMVRLLFQQILITE
jgi:hypothetical protein